MVRYFDPYIVPERREVPVDSREQVGVGVGIVVGRVVGFVVSIVVAIVVGITVDVGGVVETEVEDV